MALHYGNGTGLLYDKDIDRPVGKISYQLIWTDPTKYTKKKWWGDFTTGRGLKHLGSYIIELEDGRKGDCIVSSNSQSGSKRANVHFYHYNGRGTLGMFLKKRKG